MARASITRESSPPDPISRSGPAGTPGLGAIMNSTASPPEGPASRGLRETSKVASAIARAASCSRTASSRRGAWQLARVAQGADVACERRLRLAQSRGGRGERHLGAGELLASRPRVGGVVEHSGERPAVLAHQALDARKTLFDRVERAVLARDPLAVGAQLAGQVLGLDHERAQTLGERVQAADRRRRARPGPRRRPPSAASCRARRRRLRAPARPRPRPRRAQRIETAQASARGEQLVVLPLVEAGGVDLGELVLEQVELALARRGELAQGVELRGKATDFCEGLGAGAQAQRVIGATERVEDLELGAREGQLAVLVLAVEGDRREPRSRSSETVAERPLR